MREIHLEGCTDDLISKFIESFSIEIHNKKLNAFVKI